MTLTPRELAFVQHFRGDAGEAAILAGYSPASARTIGPRLLKKPAILAAIEAKRSAPDAVGDEDASTRAGRRAILRGIAEDTTQRAHARREAVRLLDVWDKEDHPPRDGLSEWQQKLAAKVAELMRSKRERERDDE